MRELELPILVYVVKVWPSWVAKLDAAVLNTKRIGNLGGPLGCTLRGFTCFDGNSFTYWCRQH